MLAFGSHKHHGLTSECLSACLPACTALTDCRLCMLNSSTRYSIYCSNQSVCIWGFFFFRQPSIHYPLLCFALTTIVCFFRLGLVAAVVFSGWLACLPGPCMYMGNMSQPANQPTNIIHRAAKSHIVCVLRTENQPTRPASQPSIHPLYWSCSVCMTRT